MGGTGPNAALMMSRQLDAVSVSSFGAYGDGLHDDTAAIQAALNIGRIVHLPAGTYRTTQALVMPAFPCMLVGTGSGDAHPRSIISYAGAAAGTVLQLGATGVGRFYTVSDLQIATATANVTGVDFNGSQNSDIERLYIQGCATGVLLRASAGASAIYNLLSLVYVLVAANGTGFAIQGAAGKVANANALVDCQAVLGGAANASTGISADSLSNELTLLGCDVSGNGTGLSIAGRGTRAVNLTVENCGVGAAFAATALMADIEGLFSGNTTPWTVAAGATFIKLRDNAGHGSGWYTATPGLPAGLGAGNAVTNPNPYPVRVYLTGHAGTHIVDPNNTDKALGLDPHELVLDCGAKVYFTATVPTAWDWYGMT